MCVYGGWVGDIGAFRRHTAIFPVRTCGCNPNFPLAAAKEGRCRSKGHGEQNMWLVGPTSMCPNRGDGEIAHKHHSCGTLSNVGAVAWFQELLWNTFVAAAGPPVPPTAHPKTKQLPQSSLQRWAFVRAAGFIVGVKHNHNTYGHCWKQCTIKRPGERPRPSANGVAPMRCNTGTAGIRPLYSLTTWKALTNLFWLNSGCFPKNIPPICHVQLAVRWENWNLANHVFTLFQIYSAC